MKEVIKLVFTKILPLVIVLSSCLVEHHEYKLLGMDNTNILLFKDSTFSIELHGRLTSFNDAVLLADSERSEDPSIEYSIKGIDSILIKNTKINIWLIKEGNLIPIREGIIYFNYRGYTNDDTSFRDSIKEHFNIYKKPEYLNSLFHIMTETDYRRGEIQKILVESIMSLSFKNKDISINRRDTLYRYNSPVKYQLRSH